MAKVMADAQLSAHSWHLSFLLSVRIMRAQCHDRLSIPLTEDTETTGEMVMLFTVGERGRGGGRDGDHEMTVRELKLISSQNAPCCHPGREEFIFYLFHFYLGLVGYLYIHLCRHWCLRGEP